MVSRKEERIQDAVEALNSGVFTKITVAAAFTRFRKLVYNLGVMEGLLGN